MHTNTSVENFIKQAIGKACWKSRRSFGSMIMLDFGKKIKYITPKNTEKHKGEWVLIVEMSRWQLKSNSIVITSSEHDLENIDNKISDLERATLTNIEISLDKTSFKFSGGYELIVETYNGENDGWTFHSPDDYVLVCRNSNFTVMPNTNM